MKDRQDSRNKLTGSINETGQIIHRGRHDELSFDIFRGSIHGGGKDMLFAFFPIKAHGTLEGRGTGSHIFDDRIINGLIGTKQDLGL